MTWSRSQTSEGGPYRTADPSMADEEDLWLRLDCALLEALREPVLAWGMAWSIAMDAAGRYPELIAAAEGLMSAVDGTEPGPDLVIRGH